MLMKTSLFTRQKFGGDLLDVGSFVSVDFEDFVAVNDSAAI